MTIDPTRFDAVLDKLERRSVMRSFLSILSDDDDCICRKHLKTPSMAGGENWKRYYVTDGWSAFAAMKALQIDLIATPDENHLRESENDNRSLEGYTNDSGIWLRPDPHFAIKTAAHELAHNVLGHVKDAPFVVKVLEDMKDHLEKVMVKPIINAGLNRMVEAHTDWKETEAETTALLVTEALGYPDGDKTFDSVAQYVSGHMPVKLLDRARIKNAATQILTAGACAVERLAA